MLEGWRATCKVWPPLRGFIRDPWRGTERDRHTHTQETLKKKIPKTWRHGAKDTSQPEKQMRARFRTPTKRLAAEKATGQKQPKKKKNMHSVNTGPGPLPGGRVISLGGGGEFSKTRQIPSPSAFKRERRLT